MHEAGCVRHGMGSKLLGPACCLIITRTIFPRAEIAAQILLSSSVHTTHTTRSLSLALHICCDVMCMQVLNSRWASSKFWLVPDMLGPVCVHGCGKWYNDLGIEHNLVPFHLLTTVGSRSFSHAISPMLTQAFAAQSCRRALCTL